MAREFFCAYHSLLETTKRLNDAEFGRLMRAAITYSASGQELELGGRELMAWDMVKWQIDRDVAEYTKRCEKQRQNVMKRWDTTVYDGKSGIPTHTNVYQPIPTDTKHTKEKEKEKEIIPSTYILLPEEIARLKGLTVTDNARVAQEEIAEELRDMGFSVRFEYPVEDRGDGCGGRVDLLAEKDGKYLAIEVDRNSPRQKSVHKLLGLQGFGKLILLRNGCSDAFNDCPVDVIALSCNQTQDAFETFWAAYPRHVAKDKARTAFKAVPLKEIPALMESLEKHKRSDQWTKDGGQFIPHPATWLNQKRWQGDAPPTGKGKRTEYAQHAVETVDFSHLMADLGGE